MPAFNQVQYTIRHKNNTSLSPQDRQKQVISSYIYKTNRQKQDNRMPAFNQVQYTIRHKNNTSLSAQDQLTVNSDNCFANRPLVFVCCGFFFLI